MFFLLLINHVLVFFFFLFVSFCFLFLIPLLSSSSLIVFSFIPHIKFYVFIVCYPLVVVLSLDVLSFSWLYVSVSSTLFSSLLYLVFRQCCPLGMY